MDDPESELAAWLLAAPEPAIRYQAQLYLDASTADPALVARDPFVLANIESVSTWNETILTRHDQPGLFIHRLAMVADLGLRIDTPGLTELLEPLVEGMLGNVTDEGSFPVRMLIPRAFGGSGEESSEWVICDLPVTVYALAKMGVDDPRLDRAIDFLGSLAGGTHYSCCGSIPRFSGPGPRGGMCPYANLLVARALSVRDGDRLSPQAAVAARAVLDHWTDRKTRKPFLFAMGTDFRKIKFPMVWYNLLHVLSALAPIPAARQDPRYGEMADVLRAKLDDKGRATAESIYMIYKAQEWSNKKQPSRLLTILARRIVDAA